jgi:phosphopantetheine adenylyltransferase
MHKETAPPEFVFSNPNLNSIKEADESFEALRCLIEKHKTVKINLSNVDFLTMDYADHFFGAAAVECIIKGVKMNLKFKDEETSKLVSSTVQQSINKSLPPAFGGTATIH